MHDACFIFCMHFRYKIIEIKNTEYSQSQKSATSLMNHSQSAVFHFYEVCAHIYGDMANFTMIARSIHNKMTHELFVKCL